MRILREMYREWPFFQTLLSNMDMVLAKSNIAIASRYAELVEDTELREAIFPRLRAEWQYTIEMLLAITGLIRKAASRVALGGRAPSTAGKVAPSAAPLAN